MIGGGEWSASVDYHTGGTWHRNLKWKPSKDNTIDFLVEIVKDVEEDKDWLASEFSSGYIQRAKHLFPKQGNKAPWRNYQNYIKDWFDIKYKNLRDPSMQFYSNK